MNYKRPCLALCLILPLVYLAVFNFEHKESPSSFVKLLSTHERTVNIINGSEYFRKIRVDPKEISARSNRRDTLKSVVKIVTQGATTDLEKAKLWTRFLQDKIVHPKSAPLLSNGQAIYDPIWILENKVAHCGQTNRLVIDGLETQGIEGRIVQLSNHVIAEVFVDGKFIALDADMLDYGRFFSGKNSRIPSAYEIYMNPELLNKLKGKVYEEYLIFGDEQKPKDDWWDYLRDGFLSEPYYYYKNAPEDELDNDYYGWNFYSIEKKH